MSLLACVVAPKEIVIDKDPLGSGRPFLGLKYWQIGISKAATQLAQQDS